MNPYGYVYRCDLCVIVKAGVPPAVVGHDRRLPHTDSRGRSLGFPIWDDETNDPLNAEATAHAKGWRMISIDEGQGRSKIVHVCPAHHTALLKTFGLDEQ